jgi:hypothetical protein
VSRQAGEYNPVNRKTPYPSFSFDLIEVGAQFAVDSTVMRALPRPASSTELTLEVTFG